MSAIYGLIHLDGKPVDEEELAGMGDALAMYGRDGGAHWHAGAVGLGQRLHRVTPQDAFEQQPSWREDHHNCLVVGGKVDNRPELMDLLNISIAPADVTDSELIQQAYARWGQACVHHLIGTFTFALWDARKQKLLVARSPLDSPSLFLHITPHTLAFATMPKGLFALPFVARHMDEGYLADYLGRAPSEPTATFYAQVTRLLPGQMLMVQGEPQRKAVSVQNYWQPDTNRTVRFSRDEDYVEAFNELFHRVVQDALRSRHDVGVMMSGGLDSTAVAAVAAQFYQRSGTPPRRLPTFTEVPRAGFDSALVKGRYADETPYVQAMARHYANLDLNLIQAPAASHRPYYIDNLDSLFAATETPFPNASNRLWYEAILQAAQAQGVGVLLTGSGGNLTLSWGGDGVLAQLISAGQWTQAWREARAMARRGQARAPLLTLVQRGFLPHLPEWAFLGVEAMRARLLGEGSLPNAQAVSPIRPEFAREHRVEERARAKKSHLRGRLLPNTQATRYHSILSSVRRADGLAEGYQALYGVELRDPTNDLRLVEFCLSLPETQYQRNGVNRWLVRRAMAEQLPREVLSNKERGLQAANWYENLYDARERVLAELARIEACDLARRALDLPRLRRLVEGMERESSSARQEMLTYRTLLERGIMTGSFIRWVEGGR